MIIRYLDASDFRPLGGSSFGGSWERSYYFGVLIGWGVLVWGILGRILLFLGLIGVPDCL